MMRYNSISRQELIQQIKVGSITMAGNAKLKIYGTLECSSGKRMLPENRVFFKDEDEANEMGYRPCGHCMKEAYLKWKSKPS